MSDLPEILEYKHISVVMSGECLHYGMLCDGILIVVMGVTKTTAKQVTYI